MACKMVLSTCLRIVCYVLLHTVASSKNLISWGDFIKHYIAIYTLYIASYPKFQSSQGCSNKNWSGKAFLVSACIKLTT